VTKVRAMATSIAWFLVAGGCGAVLVPWWLTGWRVRRPLPWPPGVQVVGALLVVAGLLTTMLVFAEFVRAGGTPMPGAMTQRLVVTGMNRYVRNPIYLGALAIFLGEAFLLGRASLLVYAALAWAATAAFVHWYEEPALLRRFGADYETYRRQVHAWRPRLSPWSPDGLGNNRTP
jgi:protein-S-isoprenylcysteine O-methyltransferase Ste14